MTLLPALCIVVLCIAAVLGANQRVAVALEARLNFSVWVTDLYIGIDDEAFEDEIVMVSKISQYQSNQNDDKFIVHTL
jgi:hypothetical protein